LADDFPTSLEREDDARRVKTVLPKRFALFKLTVNLTKAALIRFGKPTSRETGNENGTLDLPGPIFATRRQ
jgi:hypothetical protein